MKLEHSTYLLLHLPSSLHLSKRRRSESQYRKPSNFAEATRTEKKRAHIGPFPDQLLRDPLSLELGEMEVLWKLLGRVAFELGISERHVDEVEDGGRVVVEERVFEDLR